MEQRLTIITLGVSDLEKSTHFYETQCTIKQKSITYQIY